MKEDAQAEFREFLEFKDSWLDNELKGTTAAGREKVQQDLLDALIQFLEEHPSNIKNATRQVALGYDKVFMARSHLYGNIAGDISALREVAEQRGLDPDIIVTGLFDKAIADGPQAVAALNDMLGFRTSSLPSMDETTGTTKSDRLQAQVSMLVDLNKSLNAGFITSIQSSARDVDRVTKKPELARSFATKRMLENDTERFRQGLEARGGDGVKKLVDIIERVSTEGDEAVSAFRGMLLYQDGWLIDETQGTTRGRFEAQLNMLEAWALFLRPNPIHGGYMVDQVIQAMTRSSWRSPMSLPTSRSLPVR